MYSAGTDLRHLSFLVWCLVGNLVGHACAQHASPKSIADIVARGGVQFTERQLFTVGENNELYSFFPVISPTGNYTPFSLLGPKKGRPEPPPPPPPPPKTAYPPPPFPIPAHPATKVSHPEPPPPLKQLAQGEVIVGRIE